VTTDLDFYCLLGETFFGYRGYFGQDFHGFNDCFSEIAIHEKTIVVVEKGARVTISNSEQFKKVLNEEYFSDVIETFRKQGFEVEFD
jgi:hypothetical protein